MVNIYVTGLPENSKVSKLIYGFKNLLNNANIQKFWIKEMADIRGTNLKSATIEFYNSNDAHTALDIINGFNFHNGKMTYPLYARIAEEELRRRSPSPFGYNCRDMYEERYSEREVPHYNRYDRRYSRERDRPRSRSPHYNREASKIDMEMELLRKQRMIIEEERRLLIKRKKLELLMEFGNDAVKDFEFKDMADRDIHYRAERERDHGRDRNRDHDHGRVRKREYKQQRRSPPRHTERYNPNYQRFQPPNKNDYRGNAQLPAFFKPCKDILSEMKELMTKSSEEKNLELLTELIRSTIRKRLAIVLENKPRLTAKDILVLYREHHPKSTDEALVEKVLNDVKACELPDMKETTMKSAKGKVTNVNHNNANPRGKGTMAIKQEKTKQNDIIPATVTEVTSVVKNEIKEENEMVTDTVMVNTEVKKDELEDGKIITDKLSSEKTEAVKEHKEEEGEKTSKEVHGEKDKSESDLQLEDNSETSVEQKVTELNVSKENSVDDSSTDQAVNFALSLDANEIIQALDDGSEEWGEGDDWNDLNEDNQ